jgi:hypothetical protein
MRRALVLALWAILGTTLTIVLTGGLPGIVERIQYERTVRLWRTTCLRDHGTWNHTPYRIECHYPDGGRKTMIFVPDSL